MPLLSFILANPGKVWSLLSLVFDLVERGYDWVTLEDYLRSKLDPAIQKAKDDKDPVDLENTLRK